MQAEQAGTTRPATPPLPVSNHATAVNVVESNPRLRVVPAVWSGHISEYVMVCQGLGVATEVTPDLCWSYSMHERTTRSTHVFVTRPGGLACFMSGRSCVVADEPASIDGR